VADWDARFLGLAEHIAQWSKDPSTKTGSVIARPDHRIVSVGFNGFPRGMTDAPALYADRESKYSRIIHCEMNALMFAAQPVDGYTLYTWPFLSCDRCFVHMVQAGIVRFVAPQATDEQLFRWGEAFERVRRYARDVGVEVDEV
jgi:dCMP deaminase